MPFMAEGLESAAEGTPGIVLMADPRVAAVPVRECGEALTDVRLGGRLRVDGRRRDAAGDYAFLRAGVYERLLAAQRSLPGRLRLLFVEGYRPPRLQRAYFEEYAEELGRAHPDWPAPRLREAASRFVSPPEIAPHSAGAAVDLTLVTEDGAELDLGTRVNANPEESAGACCTEAPGLPSAARAARRVLAEALSGAGLVNYPTEWWHWSYGDRYWALSTGAPHALYGPLDREH